jgi:uncharacterized membrane protein YhaH (DUF805 family)
MNGSLQWLLFSFKGRIGRRQFATVMLAQLAFSAIYYVVFLRRFQGAGLHAPAGVESFASTAFHFGGAVGAIVLAVTVVSSWIGLAVQAKRLHDFGWSGWWLAAPMAAGFVGGFAGGFLSAFGFAIVGSLLAALAMMTAALGSLALIGIMFFRRGGEGANPFDGDSPGELGEKDAAVAFVKTARGFPFAGSGAARAKACTGDEIQLATYKPPQVRRSGFGRRSVA